MKRLLAICSILVLISGCGAGYATSELSGTAKPEGGIKEAIPKDKEYSGVNQQQLWNAVQDVLEDQGYIFSADSASGRIKTEPKMISDPSKVALFGASYYAVLAIRVKDSSVSYTARFNKDSNLVQDEKLVEYPEKENELRRDFFSALDQKVKK